MWSLTGTTTSAGMAQVTGPCSLLRADMNSEGRALDKRLATPSVHADERSVRSVAALDANLELIENVPLIGVDPKVPREITLSRKRLVAVLKGADEWADHNVVPWSDSVGVVDEL